MSRYRWIDSQKAAGFAVKVACKVAEVSTSSYYEWATSGSNGISGFGKFVPGGAWVDESSLGDAWLQVSGTLN